MIEKGPVSIHLAGKGCEVRTCVKYAALSLSTSSHSYVNIIV